MKPGGYFEQHEPSLFFYSDLTDFASDHAYRQWGEFMVEAGNKAGMRFDICDKIKGWMEEAGFVNVTEYRMPWLVGAWSKDKHQREVGQWNQLRLDIGIADFCSRRFSNQMGVSLDETLLLDEPTDVHPAVTGGDRGILCKVTDSVSTAEAVRIPMGVFRVWAEAGSMMSGPLRRLSAGSMPILPPKRSASDIHTLFT